MISSGSPRYLTSRTERDDLIQQRKATAAPWCLKVAGEPLSRAGEHGVSSPGRIARAAVEGFAGRPADVAVAGAGVAEDLGSAHHHGGADPFSLPGRRHA